MEGYLTDFDGKGIVTRLAIPRKDHYKDFMTSTPFIIAIDGPAASGKGSLARKLAETLGFAHLDTGLLYRKTGMDVVRGGGDPNDEQAAIAAARALNPAELDDPALKSDEAAVAASKVSRFAGVRAALHDFQVDFASANASGAILDGRDIGTVICPAAPVKLFVTASVEVRAVRRLKELESREIAASYDEVLADMTERDKRDTERAAAPLKPAPDAHIIDTSDMTPAAVLQTALALIDQAR